MEEDSGYGVGHKNVKNVETVRVDGNGRSNWRGFFFRVWSARWTRARMERKSASVYASASS